MAVGWKGVGLALRQRSQWAEGLLRSTSMESMEENGVNDFGGVEGERREGSQRGTSKKGREKEREIHEEHEGRKGEEDGRGRKAMKEK